MQSRTRTRRGPSQDEAAQSEEGPARSKPRKRPSFAKTGRRLTAEGKRLAALGKRLAQIEYYRRSLRVRRLVMLAVVGAWLALVGVAVTAVAAFYAVAGLVALATLWVGNAWAGPLLAGGGLLLLMLLGAIVLLSVSRKRALRGALAKLEPIPPRTERDQERRIDEELKRHHEHQGG